MTGMVHAELEFGVMWESAKKEEPGKATRENPEDMPPGFDPVDEASEESFPASDAPAWIHEGSSRGKPRKSSK